MKGFGASAPAEVLYREFGSGDDHAYRHPLVRHRHPRTAAWLGRTGQGSGHRAAAAGRGSDRRRPLRRRPGHAGGAPQPRDPHDRRPGAERRDPGRGAAHHRARDRGHRHRPPSHESRRAEGGARHCGQGDRRAGRPGHLRRRAVRQRRRGVVLGGLAAAARHRPGDAGHAGSERVRAARARHPGPAGGRHPARAGRQRRHLRRHRGARRGVRGRDRGAISADRRPAPVRQARELCDAPHGRGSGPRRRHGRGAFARRRSGGQGTSGRSLILLPLWEKVARQGRMRGACATFPQGRPHVRSEPKPPRRHPSSGPKKAKGRTQSTRRTVRHGQAQDRADIRRHRHIGGRLPRRHRPAPGRKHQRRLDRGGGAVRLRHRLPLLRPLSGRKGAGAERAQAHSRRSQQRWPGLRADQQARAVRSPLRGHCRRWPAGGPGTGRADGLSARPAVDPGRRGAGRGGAGLHGPVHVDPPRRPLRGHHGPDRRHRAGPGRLLRHEQPGRRDRRQCGLGRRRRGPVGLPHHPGRAGAVGQGRRRTLHPVARGRRPDAGRRHGAHPVGRHRRQGHDGLLVPLRHPVRGPVHPDHGGCRHPRLPLHDPGSAGHGRAQDAPDPVLDRQRRGHGPDGRAVGLFPLYRRGRSAGRDQQPMAPVRHLQPDAGGDRADAGHGGAVQDEAAPLRLGHGRSRRVAADLHGHG
uniref:LigA n=1 Tax=Parastrongyloides trichosuri TaxID=131310 RepID=A0A0N5A0Q3_PARTI